MDDATAIDAIIDMVPNWYKADIGPVDYSLESGDVLVPFWGHRQPTPQLTEFLRTVRREIGDVVRRLDPFAESVAVDLLQEHFALKWLNIVAPGVDWRRIVDYSRECLHRTYENTEVAFNLVIRNTLGSDLITSTQIHKIMDPLAASLRTYVRVDRQFRLSGYEEIPWADITEDEDYSFCPEFLRPFVSVLEDDEYSVHQTVRGDFVVMNHYGLVAAKRKGKWKLYDVHTLKNSITDAIGNYRVGANLFEVCFDLSFRRHGALLVFDPEGQLLQHVSNPESRIDTDGSPDLARRMLAPFVRPIRMEAPGRVDRKKLLFLEIASVDGAVVFNENAVLAFGAMIRTHENVPGHVGARSTAAASAYLYGGRPVKISSDGEITIYFKSAREDGREANAKLEFL